MVVNKPLKIYDGCLIDGVIWGYSNYLNSIVAIDVETYTIVKIIHVFESAKAVYKKTAYFEGAIFLFPVYGSHILKYSINNEKITKLMVDGCHMISTADIVRKGNCLYIIPWRLDTPFLEMDLHSGKSIWINKWNNYVVNVLGDKQYFSTTSYLYDDVIYTPCAYTNTVMLYDIKQRTLRDMNLDIHDDTIFSLAGHQETIYLSGNHRDKIYVWNIESMVLREMIISDININQALYYKIYVEDNNLYLFPNKSDVIKRIQLDNSNEVSEFMVPIMVNKLRTVLLYGMIRTENKLVLLPLVMNCFFVFDLDRNLWQQFSVQVIDKEIDKYIASLKVEMESESFSLINCINGISLDRNDGEKNNLNEKKECIGEKIYQTCVSGQSIY